MDTITIREFYRRAQAGKLQAGEYRLEKYGRAAYVVTVAGAAVAPVIPEPAPEVKAEVAAPAVVPAEPEPAPVVVLDVAPVVAGSPCRMDSRTAALLAKGRLGARDPEPASEPAEPEPMTRARWKRMSLEARAHHVRHFTDCTTEEERLDWEENLPA